MIRFQTFEQLGLAVAAFSEKSDGDCALTDAQDIGGLPRARQRVCQECGVPAGGLVCVRQVHGTRILQATRTQRGMEATAVGNAGIPAGPSETEADGMVTRERGVALGILTADCVPVYLFDPVRRAGGLLHAGRKGTRNGISGRAVALLESLFHTEPKDIHALIGPSAGPCCYEVSQELADNFRAAELPVEGRHLDLWEANATQLARAGVARQNIAVTGLCTICDGRFFSHRRDADGRRNLALLAL